MARNIVKNKPYYTLDEYLSNFSKNRKIDTVIKKWYQKKQVLNVSKSQEQWDRIIQEFYNETEK